MSSERQFIEGSIGGQIAARKVLPVTMVAGAVADVSFTPPPGAAFVRFMWATATAFTGAPTNINLTIGKTQAAAEYVAATDVKAQTNSTAATLVTGGVTDSMSWPSGQAIHATLTAVGGTNPAGTCYVLVEYVAPAA